MPIRDLLLFAGFGVIAPMIVIHPYVGALIWVVFGLLNPHRLTYGPAFDFPFALLIAILTLVGAVLSRDHRQIKGGAAGVVLLVLFAWTASRRYYRAHAGTSVRDVGAGRARCSS